MKMRLAVLVPSLLILSSLVSSTLLFWDEVRIARRDIEQEGISDINVSLTHLQNVLDTQLAAGNLQDAKLSLAVTALHPGIQTMLLADDKDRVMLAHRLLWLDSGAAQVSAYNEEIARQVRQTRASNVSINEPRSLLRGYYPVTLRLRAEGSGVDRIGVLFVEYDLAPQLASSRHTAVIHALTYGSLMIAVSVAVAMLLHLLVATRVRRIVAASERFAAGDLDARVQLRGGDELAELGRAFDHMASQRKQSEAAVVSLNHWLQSLLDAASGVSVIATDEQGVITLFNHGAERMLGYSAAEMVGKQTPMCIHLAVEVEDRARELSEDLGYAVSGFQTFVAKPAIDGSEQREWTYVRKDGKQIRVSLVVTTVRSEQGDIAGYLGIAQDITERKQAEEHLRAASLYTRSLIEASVDPLVTISAEGKITDVNKATEEVTGRNRYELIGTDFSDYFTEPTKAREGYQQVFRKGFVTDYPLAIRHRDGRVAEVLYNASVYRDEAGEVLGVFASARDVTERKLAEEQLRRSEHSLAEAQRIAHLGNWDLDLVHNVLTWSDEIYRIFEIDPQEFGASYGAFLNGIHPDDREMVNRAYAESVKSRKPYDIVHRLLMKDGRVKYVNEKCETYYDEDGKPLRSSGTVHDITERHRAQQEVEQLSLQNRLILDSAGEGIYGVDIDGRYTFVNPAASQLLGFGVEELLGQHSHAMIHHTKPDGSPYPPEECPILAAYKQGVVHSGSDLYWRKDGSSFPVEYVSTPILEAGKITGAVVTFSDITERKRTEEELRRYKDHLEDKVQQRTADLVLARNAAEAANLAKSVFLANMSHELRTPLNAILGFSSMMRKDQLLPDGQRQNLDIINRSGEHLLTLINDVLEMAKIEAGRVQLENAPFDLGGMVRDVTDMMLVRAQEKGLQLLVDQSSAFPRYIVGDEGRLRQVLINLVGNAVKFTQQGGVTLRLGTQQNKIPHLQIEVEDSGPGIAPADQQRVFEPFVQLGEQGINKGTGLGLTITRQFVQLMGGSISLESTEGKGSLFRVNLPLHEAMEAAIAKSKEPARGEVVGLAPGQPEYRILIVEDQRDNQLLLTRLMETVGFQVKVAENGEQGIQMFQSWHPHFIWMDRRMPVMDGMEATRRIRELPGGKEVKIVAVTASAFIEQRAEMLNVGMDDFVRKPYRSNEIYECLSKQLGVKYVYEGAPESHEQAVSLTPEMLSVLPEALRNDLKGALEGLKSERIAQVIQQAGEYDPQLQKTLIHLADNFDYPAILRALQTK